MLERRVGLLAVPGAPAGVEQPLHQDPQASDPIVNSLNGGPIEFRLRGGGAGGEFHGSVDRLPKSIPGAALADRGSWGGKGILVGAASAVNEKALRN